jgi:hypothetical protein
MLAFSLPYPSSSPIPTQPHSTPRHVLVLLSNPPARRSNTAVGRACSRRWRPHHERRGCETPPTVVLPRLTWASATRVGGRRAQDASEPFGSACGDGGPCSFPLLRPGAAAQGTPVQPAAVGRGRCGPYTVDREAWCGGRGSRGGAANARSHGGVACTGPARTGQIQCCKRGGAGRRVHWRTRWLMRERARCGGPASERARLGRWPTSATWARRRRNHPVSSQCEIGDFLVPRCEGRNRFPVKKGFRHFLFSLFVN